MVMTQTAGSQSLATGFSTTSKTRTKAIIAAALVPTDINAVTGAGAPSYTSGVQAWNGTPETLKAKPTVSRPIPISSRFVLWVCDAMNFVMVLNAVLPVAP